MAGRINYTPQAQQQLNALDDWITEKASPDVAQRFVSAILDCIDGILVFPRAGAYEVDESSGELVVNVLGVFHGGEDWEAALRDG